MWIFLRLEYSLYSFHFCIFSQLTKKYYHFHNPGYAKYHKELFLKNRFIIGSWATFLKKSVDSSFQSLRIISIYFSVNKTPTFEAEKEFISHKFLSGTWVDKRKFIQEA